MGVIFEVTQSRWVVCSRGKNKKEFSMVLVCSDNKALVKRIAKLLDKNKLKYETTSGGSYFLNYISEKNLEDFKVIVAEASALERATSLINYCGLMTQFRNIPIIELVAKNAGNSEKLRGMAIEIEISEIESQLGILIKDIIKE